MEFEDRKPDKVEKDLFDTDEEYCNEQNSMVSSLDEVSSLTENDDDVCEKRKSLEANPDPLEVNSALEKIAQFKTRISLLEKEKINLLYNKRIATKKIYHELEEEETLYNRKRMKEKKEASTQLKKISSHVKKFKQEIRFMKSTPTFLESIKELMDQIESSIMNFKQQQHQIFDDLLKEEKLLETDIEHYNKKINMWSSTSGGLSDVNQMTGNNKKSSKNNESQFVPPEVQMFEKFLIQTGGHYGGWDDIDHNSFIHLRRRVKNDDAFMVVAVTAFPGHLEEDVIQHNEWWKEYCILREKKRKAIIKWKNMKQYEREAKVSKAEKELSKNEEKSKRFAEIVEHEREERFLKLNEWRKEKENRQKLESEKAEQLRLNRLKNDEIALEKKRAEAKSKVAEYTAKKKQEKEIQQFLEENKRLRELEDVKISEEDKKRIQERDAMFLKRKQELADAKRVELEEKEKRLHKLRSQVDVQVKRDPSRLLQPTTVWKNRKQSMEDKTTSGRELHMPRRAVPSWRQNIS